MVIILGCNMLTMAQDSKVSWNAKAGLNLSNWTSADVQGNNAKLGFKVGVGMEYAFNNIWSLQPSLFLSTKGTKYSESGLKVTVNQMYLDLPVYVQARVHIEGETNLLFSAGPYIAYGIGGKISSNLGTNDTNTFGKNGLDEFDAGVGFGVGFEFGKVLVGLDGQVGSVNLKDVEGAAQNINFSVTLGYKF